MADGKGLFSWNGSGTQGAQGSRHRGQPRPAAASRGLCGACAEALSREGAEVFIAARDEASLVDLNQRLGGAGYRVTDVSQREQVEALVAAAVEAMGGLDILIVNAGGRLQVRSTRSTMTPGRRRSIAPR